MMEPNGKKVAAELLGAKGTVTTMTAMSKVAGVDNDKRFDRKLGDAEWPMQIPISNPPTPFKTIFQHDGMKGAGE